MKKTKTQCCFMLGQRRRRWSSIKTTPSQKRKSISCRQSSTSDIFSHCMKMIEFAQTEQCALCKQTYLCVLIQNINPCIGSSDEAPGFMDLDSENHNGHIPLNMCQRQMQTQSHIRTLQTECSAFKLTQLQCKMHHMVSFHR